MGLQTATVTRIRAPTVHTTFVTGMLNKLAQLISHLRLSSHALDAAAPSRKAELRDQRHNISRLAKFSFLYGYFIWRRVQRYLAG